MPDSPRPPAPDRRLVRVSGVVQGVGFRPFVARLAARLGIAGWVRNTLDGVTILAVAPATAIDAFEQSLRAEAPPAARIAALESQPDPAGTQPAPAGFAILDSEDGDGIARVTPTPDLALCDACRAELGAPADRRHGYPFINCTNCGPRYSILLELPYDRPQTTMRGFTLCPACSSEYQDPLDRRYHAQPNACPACGPVLRLLGASGETLATGAAALEGCASAIAGGGIAAVKGVGGYHLIVDACNDASVAELRRRKHREEKPLAVMFSSPTELARHTHAGPGELELLRGPVAPIVLVRRIPGSGLSDLIAPGNPWVGALLPYSPVHSLLLARLGRPVVATSGNLSEEPLCTGDEEAVERLRGIADVFLANNRPIARPVDDSVLLPGPVGPIVLRRARGLAPGTIRLPDDASDGEPLLCVGGHMKSAVALATGASVVLGPHIGDLSGTAAMEAFRRSIELLVSLLREHPQRIACDAHPGYASTRHALASGVPVTRVQHHLAHVLACLAEHGGGPGRILGVSWDGTGDGCDGTVWGGEFIVVDRGARAARRVGSLRTFRLPGGEAAVREPRRSALGLLEALDGRGGAAREAWARRLGFSDTEADLLGNLAARGLYAPATTSAGRLFDGVAALLGLARVNRFEGQAAMALESAAEAATGSPAPLSFPVGRSAGGDAERLIIDWGPAVEELLHADPTHDASMLAAAFHSGLAGAIAEVARGVGVETVALSGGCFQNRLLLERTLLALAGAGFAVLTHRDLPPNDGNLAVGQALAVRWGITQVGA